MRLVVALVVIAALAVAAAFFADHPGRVAIVWQGWQVETSVGVLAALLVVAVLVLMLLWRALSWIGRGPGRLRRRRAERRRLLGYRVLTQGMAALAAGEPAGARRSARRARTLLAEAPLSLLLAAHAAEFDGDEPAAKACFTAMLERPESEFLGLRGLFNLAWRAGDHDTARRLAARAKELRPNARWAALRLFELEARDGHWRAAGIRLNEVAKRRLIPEARARHHRGVIEYELSRAALAEGDRRRAIALAAEAQNATPDLAAPAAFHARLLLAEGRTGPAARAVERAWREAPGPELAQIWSEIHAEAAPLAQFKNMERLAAQNPADRESHLALAEAALTAGLPGEARRRLDMARAVPPGPTPRLCLLLARLEEAEGGTPARQREWLDRAAAAPPDPRYVCENCRGESLDWASRCPHCGGFDTLSRGMPSWAAPGDALPALPRADPAKDDTAGFYLPEEPLGARFGTG